MIKVLSNKKIIPARDNFPKVKGGPLVNNVAHAWSSTIPCTAVVLQLFGSWATRQMICLSETLCGPQEKELA